MFARQPSVKLSLTEKPPIARRRFSHFFLQNVRMENTMMTISVANPIIIEIDSYTVMLSPPALLENRETDHQLPLAALYHNTAGDGSRSEKYNQGLAGSVWLPLVVVAEIATATFFILQPSGRPVW